MDGYWRTGKTRFQPLCTGLLSHIRTLEHAFLRFQRWVTRDEGPGSPEGTVERVDALSALGNVSASEAIIWEIIPIKFAMASEVAGVLDQLSTKRTDMVKPGQVSFIGTPYNQRRFDQRLQRIMDKAGPLPKLGLSRTILDERTNSLLVYTTRHDLEKIKDVISKLDIPEPLVGIEALVYRVGVNGTGDRTKSAPGLAGVASFPHSPGVAELTSIVLHSVTRFVPEVSTNAPITRPAELSYLSWLINDLDGITASLTTNKQVLQHPRIQTPDGEAAHLFVGERPYPAGAYTSPRLFLEGADLVLIPKIDPKGQILLEIRQTVQTVSSKVSIANVGDVPVAFTSWGSKTQATVRDRQTILLGGFIEIVKEQRLPNVPFFEKHATWLHNAYRQWLPRKVRRELVVLIRPTILRPPDEPDKNTAKRLLDEEKLITP